MEKKKIIVGATVYLNGAKKPSEVKAIKSEPIYADWTPELQKRQDEMLERFAHVIAHDLLEYSRTGGDMDNLTPNNVYSHLREVHNKYRNKEKLEKEEKEKKKAEEKIDVKISKSDYQEFLKWKSENK